MRWPPLLVLPFLVACSAGSTAPGVAPGAPARRDQPALPATAEGGRLYTVKIRSLTLDESGKVAHPAVLAPRRESIRVIDNMLLNGDKVLTERFHGIDSFDLDEARGEVVFSAMRDKAYDVGLVSSDGSAVNWVPEDPADEVLVQWAPRGSKISYVIRAQGGDVVRTLHVPTSATLNVAFPLATIHALAWDPQAEHFAVAYSTPDASDRVEVMKYDGEERRMAVAPAMTLDVEVESFPSRALLLRPRDIRYDEKLPVVVWLGDSSWNDARASLIRNARVAVLVTREATDALWQAVDGTRWMDAKNVFTVGAQGRGMSFVPGERYHAAGTVVTAPAADIQSVAAGFIADQLKRTTPLNGSSR
jgi:hypothetical protein